MNMKLGDGPVRETLPLKPTTLWRIAWQHVGLGDRIYPGELELEVTFETNTDPRLSPPDRFQLFARHQGRGGGTGLVMSREAATDLHTALGEALEWDAHDRAAG